MLNDHPFKQSDQDIWNRARQILLSTIQSETDRADADRYLSTVNSVSIDNNVFTAFAVTSFACNLLQKNYSELLKSSLILAGFKGTPVIEFKIDNTGNRSIIVPTDTLQSIEVKKHTVDSKSWDSLNAFSSTMPLNPNYTFTEFVQGPSNSLAYATASSVAAKPGESGYNPLFIYGGTGLGKTHLMQAIGHELKKTDPQKKICYLTSEVFMNEFVNSLQNNEITQFRERYRSIDVLLVDDIQFVARRQHFQEEFFNTFTSLYGRDKQMVMTSDVPPKQLMGFEERLISRFEGGMVQEIELPSFETRLAILKKKAEGLVPRVSWDSLVFIAENIKSHVRAMEGALMKINTLMKLEGYPKDISPGVLQHLLSEFIEKEKNLKKITIEEIQASVCIRYGITAQQLLSSERTQAIVTPRQLAMYIARKYTNSSLPEIAKLFDKSHATIIHGVKTISKRLDSDGELRQALSEIVEKFGPGVDEIIPENLLITPKKGCS